MWVNEIFTSIQGEGHNTGLPTIFLRLTGCNLNCSFCDTNNDVGKYMELEEIQEKIKEEVVKENIHFLVITGGEPFNQNNQLMKLLKMFKKDNLLSNLKIQFETNGFNLHRIHPYYDYVISPKKNIEFIFKKWRNYENVYFKFIITSQDDLEEIILLRQTYDFEGCVWLQPEWSNVDALTKLILDNGFRLGNFCLSVQMHKFLNLR